jgi:hypothetical protein
MQRSCDHSDFILKPCAQEFSNAVKIPEFLDAEGVHRRLLSPPIHLLQMVRSRLGYYEVPATLLQTMPFDRGLIDFQGLVLLKNRREIHR